MVSLTEVQASNARIASTLPARLVAVFVGGTNGVGETTLKQFAKHAKQPRIYYSGRSQEAADRIAEECKKINPEGEYIFIKADTSVISGVDEVCEQIRAKEESINLLFMTIGTLIVGEKTADGLNLAAALCLFCRTRFILNLLPLLHKATGLRRVVSVFCGTKEGQVFPADLQGWHVPLLKQRGHGTSIVTLSLEAIAKRPEAQGVSFIHAFPGAVKSGIARGTKGLAMGVLKVVFTVLGPLVQIPLVEAGERHLFLATSSRYKASVPEEADGVPLEKGALAARGVDGKEGSGVYSTDQNQESANAKVEALLAGFRKDGLGEKIWEQIEAEYVRISGKVSL